MPRTPIFVRRRVAGAEHPVELRFVDMLLIIIATLMFVTILLSVVSAFNGSGRPEAALRVTTVTAPDAVAGHDYELALAAEGGDGDYSWKLVDGELPNKLELDKRGVIAGTPSTPTGGRPSAVRVRVTDGAGRTSDPQKLTVQVRPAGDGSAEHITPRIDNTITLLPGAVEGKAYKFTMAATNSDLTWKRASGKLPDGLKLAPDGTVTGRPEAAGSYTFTATMAGSDIAATKYQIRLVVAEAPKSLFWTILDWAKTIFAWMAYLLLCLVILNQFWTFLFGRPGYEVESKAGRWQKWFGRSK